MLCSKCNGATELRSGTSKKNGKPWQGFKCLACDNMDFVKDQPGTTKIIKETGPLNVPHTENNIKEKTMILSYAKDVVVKRIEVGIAEPGDAAVQIIAIYRSLCSEVFNPLK